MTYRFFSLFSLRAWGLVVAALTFTCAAPAAMITGLFNTGVDENGNVLPVGSLEQHYSLSGAADTAYVVSRVYHDARNPAWVQAPAGSAWIGPNGANPTSFPWPNDDVGTYYYTLAITVDLTGYNIAQAQISGVWATDNSGEIWLNGAYTGFNTSEWGFVQLNPFLIQTGFRAGINTLEFRVLNGGTLSNPSGLLVAGLKGVDDGTLTMPMIPEPSTMLTASLLVLPLAAGAIRRMRTRR